MKTKIFLVLIISSSIVSCINKDSNKKTDVSASNEITDIDSQDDNDLAQKGFELWDTETIGNIQCGERYERIVEIYGEPENETEPIFSDVDGATYIAADYISRGISITYLIKEDSIKEVSDIEIVKPCELKTSRDVGIGSTYSEVKNAYEGLTNNIGADSVTIIVGSIYGGLVFNFEDNKVSRVFIGASAE